AVVATGRGMPAAAPLAALGRRLVDRRAPGHDHRRPAFPEHERDPPADAAGGAGHHCDTPVEIGSAPGHIVPAVNQALLDEAVDWLRIPSISTGEGSPADLERAAMWVIDRVRGAGG